MSTLRVNTINDASGGSNAQLFGVASPPNSMGNRNRIINGGMVISQRNGTSSVNVPGTSYPYQMDRFYCGGLSGVATPFTLQQVTDAPTGFSNSVRITVANTDALGNAATEYGFQTTFEANNTSDFNLGTANAITVTLSFWVKSSLTGTFGLGVRNAPTFNRAYVATYTINSANTWEFKTITIPLDTTGTWNSSGANASLNIGWSLGVGTNLRGTANTWQAGGAVQTSGSVNLVSNAAATWQITGVQLEAGTVASPFERRDYGRELMMCQRYFESLPLVSGDTDMNYAGFVITGTLADLAVKFQVTKRTAPTCTLNGSVTQIRVGGSDVTATGGFSFTYISTINAALRATVNAGGLSGGSGAALKGVANSSISASSEL